MVSSKPTPGVNDLQSQFPEVAKEWHPLRNGDLKPTEVTRGSAKKVWWQCSKYPDHEWEASITSRTLGGRCPNCYVKIWTPKITNGINDLQSQNPELAKEWHPLRNGDLKPTEVTRSSSKKVWWQCSKYPDHEWQASINSRSSGSVGCPICSGIKVLEGSNDLKSTDPELAKEWHPLKNGDLKPTGVTRGSDKKVWWQCSKYPDHEWQAAVRSRSRGNGCTICRGLKVLEGSNDLKSTDPELAEEWHSVRNGDLKPTEVTRGSGKKVWWRCSKYPDHEWDAVVDNRSRYGQGCAICSGLQVLEGFNDLKSTDPELAKEWHPLRNGDLKPTEVTRGSSKKVWWQCNKYSDHEWETRVGSRTNGSVGCPICSGAKVLEGSNDLKSTDPELAKEWHPLRNGDLKPTEVTRGSSKKVWWQCSKYPDHEWEALIFSRSDGTSCPICAEHGFNPNKDSWFYLMQRPGEQQLGITNVLSDRLRKHESNGWMLLEHAGPASGQKVFDTEKVFKKWLKKEIGLIKGTTENWSTTKMEVQSLAELKARSGIETDLF